MAECYAATMRILALDGALACCAAAVVIDDRLVAAHQVRGARGHAAVLPGLVEAALAGAGLTAMELDAIAVTIGPGSFTGLRAALALAHGLGTAAGCPVVGVSVAEAMAAALPNLGGRELWVAIDNRRGRIFLHRAGQAGGLFAPEPTALDALPRAERRIAVAGDAAPEVASRLAARETDVMLTDLRLPPIRQIALVGAERLRGERPALPAQPLYVDPPEARLPQGGLRPAPR